MSSRVRRGWIAFCASLAMAAPTRVAAQQRTPPVDSAWSFAVLGHVRGYGAGLHPRLGELLRDVTRYRPALMVLAGDLILGDMNTVPRRPDVVRQEWQELDSALAATGVPWIQTIGNHDINDLVTRDIYRERYEPLPRSVTVRDARFLLLRSAWVPEDGDTAHGRYTRGIPIDSAQIAWLRTELSRPGPYRHTFVVVHHLLWWEGDDSPWWREVHPLLRDAGVRAVFSGDHGPFKFSHRRRDGVDYYQTSIGGNPSTAILNALESSRILAMQFDNFLIVTLRPDSVAVEVEVTGAVTSDHFTPARYDSVYRYRPIPLAERVRNTVTSPLRMGAAAFLVVCGLLAGLWLGLRRARRR